MEIIIAPRTSEDLGEYCGFDLRGFGWIPASTEVVAMIGLQAQDQIFYRVTATRGREDRMFHCLVAADKDSNAYLLRAKERNARSVVEMKVDDFLQEPRR